MKFEFYPSLIKYGLAPAFAEGKREAYIDALILDIFRKADRSILSGDKKELYKTYSVFCQRFDGFHFGYLEELFREKNRNIHFLAVPADRFEQLVASEEAQKPME